MKKTAVKREREEILKAPIIIAGQQLMNYVGSRATSKIPFFSQAPRSSPWSSPVANRGAKRPRILGLVSFTCIPICGIIRNEERTEKEAEPDCFDFFGISSGKPLGSRDTYLFASGANKKVLSVTSVRFNAPLSRICHAIYGEQVNIRFCSFTTKAVQ